MADSTTIYVGVNGGINCYGLGYQRSAFEGGICKSVDAGRGQIGFLNLISPNGATSGGSLSSTLYALGQKTKTG